MPMTKQQRWKLARQAEGRCPTCGRRLGSCPSIWRCWVCLVHARGQDRARRQARQARRTGTGSGPGSVPESVPRPSTSPRARPSELTAAGQARLLKAWVRPKPKPST